MTFVNQDIVEKIKTNYKLPVYLYNEKEIKDSAQEFANFSSAFGHTPRYAMKASSNINILKILKNQGFSIDASSEFEVYRALNAGFEGKQVQLSGQQLPEHMENVLDKGVYFVANSLYQLEQFGKIGRGSEVGIRVNPGISSGAFEAIATGGPSSSFGIRYEYIPLIKGIAQKYNLRITKLHIHIGSENTPQARVYTAGVGFDILREFEDINTLNLGGGFKKAIMPYEKTADLQSIQEAVKEKFEEFYQQTGRKIHLEVEPGKYVVINACSVIGKVIDKVDTGQEGYTFLKVNTGMTEMPRFSLYGVQQPISVFNNSKEAKKYVVVGHCCESGDMLTCKLYEPETIQQIELPKTEIGDVIVVDGAGAYNSTMSMKNYNSFPEAGELLLRENGELIKIRERQNPEDIWKNEIEAIQ
ncbi:diaminopimelate decarboxylase [Candidatus Absconditicoccus praedator]|uniref:diaminopimelate decarboxylase n=1 Tax=Candidatus Absconditicoccus praedator TaxID=2735562 RepID=UPI001E3E6B7F|nr:diaminopimelate decarboxylase [Candidatus Absconditicoccus praedator]UFX82559.1 diaminopimelate decarboxylase [Candidatus Absconditicoccus praedator]